MLSQAVTIIASGGASGAYTAQVLFANTSMAKYVAVGDMLLDRTGNQYAILSHSSLPNDFVSGGTLTVAYDSGPGGDVKPATFASFGDAAVFTPFQEDVRSAVRTAGSLTNQSVYSGKDYLYTISASWYNTTEASQAAAGDYIVDNSGKLFEITQILAVNATSVRATEVHREGASPTLGAASLFRPTANYKFYQGTEITDPARTYVFNRDKFLIDKFLGSGGGSSNGDWVIRTHTLTAGEVAAGEFTMNPAALVPGEVMVDLLGGAPQKFNTDFTIVGSRFIFTGYDLETHLTEGDVIRLAYFA